MQRHRPPLSALCAQDVSHIAPLRLRGGQRLCGALRVWRAYPMRARPLSLLYTVPWRQGILARPWQGQPRQLLTIVRGGFRFQKRRYGSLAKRFGISDPGWFMKTEYRVAEYERANLPETFVGGGLTG